MLQIKKNNKAATARRTVPAMRRKWVETGDARCPLACVWFALGSADAVQSNPPELCEGDRPWPALLRFKLRKDEQAFSSSFHRAA